MSILQKPHQLPNSIFWKKCYHIICRHQYTHVTNSILFVVCPFKIGFHPSENHLYFISVFIYTFIKVKLTKGRKRDGFAKTKPNQTYRLSLLAAKYEQSKYEDWAKYNSKQSNTHLLPGHKKTTRKSVNLSSILQPESAK